jgi:hypothetical protein
MGDQYVAPFIKSTSACSVLREERKRRLEEDTDYSPGHSLYADTSNPRKHTRGGHGSRCGTRLFRRAGDMPATLEKIIRPCWKHPHLFEDWGVLRDWGIEPGRNCPHMCVKYGSDGCLISADM